MSKSTIIHKSKTINETESEKKIKNILQTEVPSRLKELN